MKYRYTKNSSNLFDFFYVTIQIIYYFNSYMKNLAFTFSKKQYHVICI